MTHPSFHKRKQYQVTLDQDLQPLHHQFISDHGIELPDGTSKLQLTRLKDGDNKQWLVSMHEGRNRQIRRTFAALGYTVVQLHRTQFGPYVLGKLAPGTFESIS
jgi:23S rRNA pseudouridine2605 synthase